ncbi:MAG: DUF128 domain-containing protein [Planctomycetes bacterium]|nr:DUF128 domain-containing protein [Planctomycetota bacterium]
MKDLDTKREIAILRVLRDAGGPVGSAIIARELQAYGFNLSGRTIRLYLEEMERDGLVGGARKGRGGGRTITPRGEDEIKDALITDRVGFTAARVDALAWQMTFDLDRRSGLVVLNVTTIETAHAARSVEAMIAVFRAGLGMGTCAALAGPGERLGQFTVPAGHIGIGTVCSVTLNGVLLTSRVPTVSRFGGVLELEGREPRRFTDVIYYDGTSLDPLEVFIKGGLTTVREAARTGCGRIGASFREIPTSACPQVEENRRRMRAIGLDGVLQIGKPNQPLLEFPVHEGRTGIIVTGGLNPTAAIEEAGIPTRNFALCTLYEFEKLIPYAELPERLGRRTPAAGKGR